MDRYGYTNIFTRLEGEDAWTRWISDRLALLNPRRAKEGQDDLGGVWSVASKNTKRKQKLQAITGEEQERDGSIQENEVEQEDIKQERRDHRRSQAKLRCKKERVEISRVQYRNRKTPDSQWFRRDLGGKVQPKHRQTPDNHQMQRDLEDSAWVGEGMGSLDI